jgi:hypothetical protein
MNKPFDFAGNLVKKERNLGEPRQASHKLNKRQFKKNCGYKEVSSKRPPLMPISSKPIMTLSKVQTARDKGGSLFVPFSPKPILPSYGAKTSKRFGLK